MPTPPLTDQPPGPGRPEAVGLADCLPQAWNQLTNHIVARQQVLIFYVISIGAVMVGLDALYAHHASESVKYERRRQAGLIRQ